jgi:CubicO group peptidase (beta-lactamase class C family)
MKTTKKFLFLFAALFCSFFIARCQGTDSKAPELVLAETDNQEQKVEKAKQWLTELQQNNHFNGGVLLIKNDSVIFKETFGYTDYSQTKKLDVHSAFRLASVSKQFTAAGIMLLKEQGKLEFDDPITKYLPNLKYSKSTIRNLLNHTSGIPDAYMGFPNKYKEEIGSELEISEVVNLLEKANLPYANEPNSKFKYNNTGYVLLAAIVESVSGESFESFMNRELLEKLEMKDSRVWNLVTLNPQFKNKTGSFRVHNDQITELPPGVFDGISGDGGIFCSLNDFIIWNEFWDGNDLLSNETIAEAFKVSNFNNGKENTYAFGWNVTDNGGAWHNGSWLGARTLIARNGKLKNCLVVLDNSSSVNVDFIGQQLVQLLR